MNDVCGKCGGHMEAGIATTHRALINALGDDAESMFVVPGTPTSSNPIKAFMQGL